MKLLQLLPLAVFSTAFVVPDEEVLAGVAIENHHEVKSWTDRFPCKTEIIEIVQIIKKPFQKAKNAVVNEFDQALIFINDVTSSLSESFDDSDYAINGWLEPGIETDFEGYEFFEDPVDHPHHPPPPHHPPGKHKPHKPHKPHRPHRPHRPPHHSNKTIYQLISESKYTTKLAKIIGSDSELVSLLNSTKANYTLFAPTDNAFKKIPKGHKKPSEEIIKKVLRYHIAPGEYPAGRVIFSKTVPTLLKEPLLGGEPQRIAARLSLRGLTLNFYARAVAVNIGASNGFIHGLDSILIPPPKTFKILELLPSEFSTLLLGLGKTGLLKTVAEAPRVGGTFFAPSNTAFRKLGPKLNAFLFSKPGEKYLAALLKYHVVLNQTLYQTAFYNGTAGSSQDPLGPREFPPTSPPPFEVQKPEYLHFQLPTLLEGHSIAVDIGRVGPFVPVRVNGFIRLAVADGVARDGVIHVPKFVLVPPKKVPGRKGEEVVECWGGEEMDVDDFKSRFEPLLDGEDDGEGDLVENEFKILPIDGWKDL